MDKHSYLQHADINTIEKLYQDFLNDPDSIDSSWQKFFEGFEFARKNFKTSLSSSSQEFDKEFKVINLIEGYRRRGHLFTETNPVRERRKYRPTLDVNTFGLSVNDLDTVFQAGTQIGIGPAKLRDIVEHLKATYCRSVGAEYMFIRIPEILNWFATRLETNKNTPEFTAEEKKNIFFHLNHA